MEVFIMRYLLRSFLLFITLLCSRLCADYAAGVLPYTVHNNRCYVLLGKEARWKWKFFKRFYWSDFGGRADDADGNNLKYTAAREFSEETAAAYGDGNMQKSIAYMFRRIDTNATVSDGNYTMYLVKVDYKDIAKFNKVDYKDIAKFNNASAVDHQEKIAYAGIGLSDLFNYIQSPRSLLTSSFLNKKDGKRICLYPKMCALLESPTGMTILRNLLESVKHADTTILELLSREPKKTKTILQKCKKIVSNIFSFRPILKLAGLFK
jgi:hypothetical protein